MHLLFFPSFPPGNLLLRSNGAPGACKGGRVKAEKSRIALAALVLVLGSMAAPATQAKPLRDSNQQPIPATFFGLTVQKFATVRPALEYGTTRSWDGQGLAWAQMNPAPGKYNFAALDNFIAINQARGIQMIYTFGRTPRWASSKPDAPGAYAPGQCGPPTKMAAWDNYVRAIVTHAAGRIQYWELWNEPNDQDFYCGSIPEMVGMAGHAAKIIKSIDPAARILSPAVTGGSGPAWLRSFLAENGKVSADIIAFHGYASARPEDILKVVARYRAVMKEDGVAAKPLWDTEANWGGAGLKGVPGSAGQAAFVAEYYLLQWSAGVRRFIWYAYDGKPQWGQLWNPITGISAGGRAYAQVRRWMAGARMTVPCALNSDKVWVCPLSRSGGRSAEAVWSSGGDIRLRVPSKFKKVAELTGATHGIQHRQVTVTAEPVLLYSSGFIREQ